MLDPERMRWPKYLHLLEAARVQRVASALRLVLIMHRLDIETEKLDGANDEAPGK